LNWWRYGKIDHYAIAAGSHMRKRALEARSMMQEDTIEPVRIITAESVTFDGQDSIDLSGNTVVLLEIRKRGLIHVGNFSYVGKEG
jgi:hypothetical protein